MFKNQLKVLNHDGYLRKFRSFMLAQLMYNNKYLNDISGEVKMITVALFQAGYDLCVSLDTLKAQE